MHLDEEAGKASILGGLAASGWHTAAMMMRMIVDAYIGNSTARAHRASISWIGKKPVLAGDTLSGRGIVQEARPLRSKPGIGLVRMRTELENQKGEIVCIAEQVIMFGMRAPEETAA